MPHRPASGRLCARAMPDILTVVSDPFHVQNQDGDLVGYQKDGSRTVVYTPRFASDDSMALRGDLVMPNTSGAGIKIDTASPDFGWRDIIGAVSPKATGAGSPTRAIYAGANIADYSFALNDVCDFCFHIPHDYASGTDLYFHVHWSHNGTSISGDAVFTVYHTYAKRLESGLGVFPAEMVNTVTWPTVNIATTPQYAHRVDEIAITSAAGAANLTANTVIEPDGLLLVNLKLTTLPTIGGSGKLFVHTCDLHYQSTNIGTKNSGPNYYE